MKKLEHTHVVKYIDDFQHLDFNCILLEFCPVIYITFKREKISELKIYICDLKKLNKKLGDLRFFIDEKSFRNNIAASGYIKNNEIKLEWSIELFDALSFVHSKKIVHRDVNPK